MDVHDGMRVKVYNGTRMDVTGNTTIYSGADFTLQGDMTITGDFTNSGSASAFTVVSDATGTGSLIVSGSSTGEIDVERFITDNSWHLVAPSTTGVTANDFYWNNAPASWLTSHNEQDNTWTYNTDLSTPMPVGQGWSVWLDANTKTDATATMTGELHTADITLNLEYTDASHGFNLLGNPYTSALDFNAGSWDLTNVEGTIWVWENSSDNYIYRSQAGGGTMANGIIPVSQGFFVRASGTSPTLTIPADARTHHSQSFYKEGAQENGYNSYITLRSNYGELADEIWIGFGEHATEGFDNGFDASKMAGGESAPQMYLRENGKRLSIDYLPRPKEEERVVAMSYIPGKEGEQELIANLSNLPDMVVILEDLNSNLTQNLNEDSIYTFDAYKNDDYDRFLLHFKSTPFGLEETGKDHLLIDIYSYNELIYIQSDGVATNEPGVVEIFNITGQKIMEQKIPAGNLISVPVDNTGNIVLVRAIKPSSTLTEKIFIQ